MTCKNKSLQCGSSSSSSIGTGIGTGVGSSSDSISISIGTTPTTTTFNSSKNSVPYDEHSHLAAPAAAAATATTGRGGGRGRRFIEEDELRRSRGGRSSSLSGQRPRMATRTAISKSTSLKSNNKKKKKASTGGQAGITTTTTTTTRRRKVVRTDNNNNAKGEGGAGGRPRQYLPPRKVRPKSSLRRSTTEQRPAEMSKLSLSSNSIVVGVSSDSRGSSSSSSSVTGSSSSTSSTTTTSSSSSSEDLEEQQRLKQCPPPPSKIVQFEISTTTTPPPHSKPRRRQSCKKSNSNSSNNNNNTCNRSSNNERIRNTKTLMLHPDQLILVEQQRQQQQKPMIMIQNLEEIFMVAEDDSSRMEKHGSGIGAVGGSSINHHYDENENEEVGVGNNNENDLGVDKEQQWYRQKEYEYERVLLTKRGRGTHQDSYFRHNDTTDLDLLDSMLGEDSRNMTYNFDDHEVDDRGCRAIDQLELLAGRLRCGVDRIGGARRGGILKNNNKSVTFDNTIVIVSDHDMKDDDFGEKDIRAATHNQYNCSSTLTHPAEPDSNSVVLTTTTTAVTTQANSDISSGIESSQPQLSNHRSILTSIHEKFLVPIHGNMKNNFATLLLECGDKNSYLLEEERMIIDNSTSLCTKLGSHTLIRKTVPVTCRDDDDDDVTKESRQESMSESGNRMEKEKTKFYAQSKAAEETMDKSNGEKMKSQQTLDSFVLPVVHSAQGEIPRRQQKQQRAYDNVNSTPMTSPVHVSTSLPQDETVAREKSCRCIPTVPHWLKRRKCESKEQNDLQIAAKESEPKIDKVLCFIKL